MTAKVQPGRLMAFQQLNTIISDYDTQGKKRDSRKAIYSHSGLHLFHKRINATSLIINRVLGRFHRIMPLLFIETLPELRLISKRFPGITGMPEIVVSILQAAANHDSPVAVTSSQWRNDKLLASIVDLRRDNVFLPLTKWMWIALRTTVCDFARGHISDQTPHLRRVWLSAP